MKNIFSVPYKMMVCVAIQHITCICIHVPSKISYAIY